ncbi:MAG: ATP-binding protein [Verrucomicrobia bacterium]|nr:ATP-binding protein [Verrucomicrobiota bacterium]MBU4247507.1 ATP-binding protein [Verrucomicrobiota bacterium]MBU4289476.1 ATP-binding protein [Verrucomicrobiota bacterium]MBU4496640.1 ATP-binding protein [Verrucomicrobiota bacterium]MCG2680189.1 ATP-binding protein [Kiritimatiellia bacterium]
MNTRNPSIAPDPLTPQLLDLVRRETDYAVYYDGRPLTTPDGKEVAHANARALGHLLRTWSFSRAWDWDCISAAALFRLQIDVAQTGSDGMPPRLITRLKDDPILQRIQNTAAASSPAGSETAAAVNQTQSQAFLPTIETVFAILICLNEFLLERGFGPLEQMTQTPERLTTWIQELYQTLPSEKKAALILLDLAHQSVILLPLLLILGRITPSEYGLALLAIQIPSRTGLKPGESMPIPTGFSLKPSPPDRERPEESYRLLRAQAADIIEYLTTFTGIEQRPASIKDLITRGESFDVEFKSSLRWNIKAGRNDAAIEHACLKTLAAFLNSAGGILLIGVQDTGALEGIEVDNFANSDKFALHFWNLVKASMGQDISVFIRTSRETMDGKTVFCAQCRRSHQPVFLQQSGFEEEFYIRVGPSSTRLTIQEALKYIPYRFGEQKVDQK